MRMEGMARAVDRGTEIVVTLLGGSIFALGVIQVFFRYVVQSSLGWSEELSRYLFVWLIFIGAAVALPKGFHIAIDMLVTELPLHVRRWVQGAASVSVLLFFIFLIIEGVHLCNLARGQTSAAMEIPMAIAYLCIPLGSLLMFFNTVRVLISPKKEKDG
jgi:TRAP-type C4-dicarboxylate transport system permease small subunit